MAFLSLKSPLLKVDEAHKSILIKMEESCSHILKLVESLPNSENKDKLLAELNRQDRVIKRFKQ